MTDWNTEYETQNEDIHLAAKQPQRLVLLQEASRLTAGDRNKDYGDPVENHQHIADIFNAISGRDIAAREVALFHIATKLARMKTSPTKADNYIDGMAYLGIAFECAIAEAEITGAV